MEVLNNKGFALLKLVQLQSDQDQESAAVESCQAALTLFGRSLAIAPNDTQVRQIYDQLTQALNTVDS